jgi:hypothetical protein
MTEGAAHPKLLTTVLQILLNSIGIDSPFHNEFDFYAYPMDINTADLPKGWQGRLVNFESPATVVLQATPIPDERRSAIET